MVFFGEGTPRYEPLKTEEMPLAGAKMMPAIPPEEMVSPNAGYNLTDDGVEYAFETGEDLSDPYDAIITHISQAKEQGRALSYGELFEYHKQHGFKAGGFNGVMQKLMKDGMIYKTG